MMSWLGAICLLFLPITVVKGNAQPGTIVIAKPVPQHQTVVVSKPVPQHQTVVVSKPVPQEHTVVVSKAVPQHQTVVVSKPVPQQHTVIIHHPPKCSLGGWWTNEMNVTMRLTEDIPRGSTIEFNGIFYGNHEVDPNSGLPKLDSHATIRGSRVRTTHKTFGLVVSFSGGGSAIWVGQCYVHDSQEHLEAIWLYRTPADYDSHWSSTRVGKDVWTRLPNVPAWHA